jgi:hypothetical protein
MKAVAALVILLYVTYVAAIIGVVYVAAHFVLKAW